MTTTHPSVNDSGLNLDHLEALRKIGILITTQDNRITDQPMFIVQQRRRMYGLDTGYCENFIWLCSEDEYNEASAEEADTLEAEYQDTGRVKDGWQRTGYTDQWEFVTACFTEQGCIDYLKLDGHNLKEPRIYAEGSYRNDEFRIVRNALIALARRAALANQPALTDWQAAHADMVKRNALLRERPDLPADRIPAHAELVRLQEENARLRANQPAPTVPAGDAFRAAVRSMMEKWHNDAVEAGFGSSEAAVELDELLSEHQPAQEQAEPDLHELARYFNVSATTGRPLTLPASSCALLLDVIRNMLAEVRVVAAHQPAPTVPATREAIEEAAQVFEAAAAHNRSKGRTILAHSQQSRAERIRQELDGVAAHQPAPQQAACTVPPDGWYCTRTPEHDGPCAASPAPQQAAAPGSSPEIPDSSNSAPGTPEAPQTAAARDVLAERQRQVEQEGWTLAHDDQYRHSELAHGAAAYALVNDKRTRPACWPWAVEWWKPLDDRRNLVRAGALVLAEIERLDRAAQLDGGQEGSES
jgi:hypothetical protein